LPKVVPFVAVGVSSAARPKDGLCNALHLQEAT
jgi:hypothetical protein